MVQDILTCSTGTSRIVSQLCSINGAPEFDCQQPFDISSSDLPSGLLNITVTVTDQFQQTVVTELATLYIAQGNQSFDSSNQHNTMPTMWCIGDCLVGNTIYENGEGFVAPDGCSPWYASLPISQLHFNCLYNTVFVWMESLNAQ